MNESNQDLVDACDLILKECLGASRDDKALVIFDESSIRFADLFSHSFINKGIRGTFIYIPINYQAFLTNDIRNLQPDGQVRLPRAIEQSISDSTLVLTLLQAEPATGALRRDIVRHSRNSQARFGHIPGIDEDILLIMRVSPIEKIRSQCQLMAWHLGAAQRATLATQDHAGNIYELTMEIGGWHNNPLMSTSIIERGSWGNIPPGEAFVCPIAGLSRGQVCVNGSALGRTRHNDEVLLTFEDGRLISHVNLATGSEDHDFRELQTRSTAHGDQDWNCLAELGIGLNPAIRKLNGNPLFDEKAAGTVHVAIGDNTGFGGSISSRHHSDLVCRSASLKLDGLVAVESGTFKEAELDSYRTAHRPPIAELRQKMRVRLLPANLEVQNGRLFRRLSNSGRFELLELFFDGDRDSCMLVIDELLEANESGAPISISSLCNSTGVSSSDIKAVISYLLFFNMAEVLEQRNDK